jgi:hypothetical protein
MSRVADGCPCRQDEMDVGSALGSIYLRKVWLSGRAFWRRVTPRARACYRTKLRGRDFENVLKSDTASAGDRHKPHAAGRVRSARRRRRGAYRFRTNSRTDGDGGNSSFAAATGACSSMTVTAAEASMQARNARPASVICQPVSLRSTSNRPKMSRSGARAARRFVRSVQSEPLEIRIATARLRSSSDRRPSGCPAKTFKTVI